MFGDIMHGIFLSVFAAYICFTDRKPGTVWASLGQFRYLLLLMGLFSTYCGFVYNDMASIPLTLWGGSCYKGLPQKEVELKSDDCVYPFGLDPVWYVAKNELAYMNSLKMKLSVILGVAQMSLGVVMKGLNSIYFGKPVDFIFEFIPQIVMLLALFGFMDLVIIIKWLTNFGAMAAGQVPPSIIAMMI
jgi:V-type H+-transporting ATPase subunit a